MIRDAVERLVLEEGVDTFKQFMREAIEDGRRAFKSRVRGPARPRPLPLAGFTEARYADKTEMPKRARRDHDHARPLRGGRRRATGAGPPTCAARPPGAGTPSTRRPAAQQGMQWILFTQTLICNDKINDGAYYATELKLTEGSWADLGDAPCSSSFPWMPMFCTSTGYLRAISRALQSRGYIEEIVGDVHGAGQRRAGRRHRPVRPDLGVHELRDRGAGPGRQVRPRRPGLRRRRVQPRGRHGRHRDVGARQAR